MVNLFFVLKISAYVEMIYLCRFQNNKYVVIWIGNIWRETTINELFIAYFRVQCLEGNGYLSFTVYTPLY